MSPDERKRYGLKLRALAAVLIVGGFVVLLLLERMPLPLRMLVGATDVIAGVVLLVVAKQKFSGGP